jgi:hypothetical protein
MSGVWIPVVVQFHTQRARVLTLCYPMDIFVANPEICCRVSIAESVSVFSPGAIPERRVSVESSSDIFRIITATLTAV